MSNFDKDKAKREIEIIEEIEEWSRDCYRCPYSADNDFCFHKCMVRNIIIDLHKILNSL